MGAAGGAHAAAVRRQPQPLAMHCLPGAPRRRAGRRALLSAELAPPARDTTEQPAPHTCLRRERVCASSELRHTGTRAPLAPAAHSPGSRGLSCVCLGRLRVTFSFGNTNTWGEKLPGTSRRRGRFQIRPRNAAVTPRGWGRGWAVRPVLPGITGRLRHGPRGAGIAADSPPASPPRRDPPRGGRAGCAPPGEPPAPGARVCSVDASLRPVASLVPGPRSPHRPPPGSQDGSRPRPLKSRPGGLGRGNPLSGVSLARAAVTSEPGGLPPRTPRPRPAAGSQRALRRQALPREGAGAGGGLAGRRGGAGGGDAGPGGRRSGTWGVTLFHVRRPKRPRRAFPAPPTRRGGPVRAPALPASAGRTPG